MTFLLVSCYCFKVAIRFPFHQVNTYWWQHVRFPRLLLLMQNPGVLLLCKFPSSRTCLRALPTTPGTLLPQELYSWCLCPSPLPQKLINAPSFPARLCSDTPVALFTCLRISCLVFFTQSWFLGGLAFFFLSSRNWNASCSNFFQEIQVAHLLKTCIHIWLSYMHLHLHI